MFYAEPFGKLVNAFAPGKDSASIVADAFIISQIICY